jgi:peroxiredoxin
MGYRIDGEGRIASELAIGAEPLLQLASGVAPHQHQPGHSANGSARHHAKDDPSLARSRLNRNGLKAGTPAPDFRLPRIDGGELSLADLRGGRVLLVFSSPDCGPCDELAPRLQQVHLERRDLQVVVVSRRELDANRAKATKLGLSYPIVLQKQWEISLKYAMFSTPIGYMIDAQGVLLSDVAVGVEPILALARESVHVFDDDGETLPAGKEQTWAV